MSSHHKPGGAPMALDAEKAVIGSILISGVIPAGLTRDLFYHPFMGQCFDLAQEQLGKGLGVDLTSMIPRIMALNEPGLVVQFVALPADCPSLEAVPSWVRLLKQKRQERRIYWHARDMHEAVAAQDYERAAALQKAPLLVEDDAPEAPAAAAATSNAGPDRAVLREVKRQVKRQAAATTVADFILRNDPAWAGKIWWDEYRKQIMMGGACVSDPDYQRVSLWLDRTYRVKVAPAQVTALVAAIAHDHGRNPLQEYLRGLRWDGVDRLSMWLTHGLGVEASELHRMIGRRWVIQAVARALRPGCKADVVLVLTGKQGVRKSTALKALAGGEFFSDSPIPIGEGPRGAQQIYTAWIHELSELASLRGKAVEDVKSFITKTHDDFIPMYGRAPVHWARFCVFAGTTNEDTFLSDPTGARRFWPVRALKVDIDWIKLNRDQLWAEAVAALEAGEQWWLEQDEEEVISEVREQYQREETWEDIVRLWLSNQPQDAISNTSLASALTAARLLGDALKLEPNQHTTSNITRIGQVMKRLGYVKIRPTLSGQRPWVYTKENAG
jgi:hypothetical protein